MPSYWWQSRDPQKYFLVEALDTLAPDTFLQTLSADDVLLFVHGYNTDFEAAILRTAAARARPRVSGQGRDV